MKARGACVGCVPVCRKAELTSSSKMHRVLRHAPCRWLSGSALDTRTLSRSIARGSSSPSQVGVQGEMVGEGVEGARAGISHYISAKFSVGTYPS